MKIIAIILSIVFLLAGVLGVIKLVTPQPEEAIESETLTPEIMETMFAYSQDFEGLKTDLGEFSGSSATELLKLFGWNVRSFPALSSVSVVNEEGAENSYLHIKNVDGKSYITIAEDDRLRNGFDIQFDYYLPFGAPDPGPFNVVGSDTIVGTWNVSIRSSGEILNSCKSDANAWLDTAGMYTGSANNSVESNLDRWKTIRITGSYESGVSVYMKDRGAAKWEKVNHYSESLLHFSKKCSSFMDGMVTLHFVNSSDLYLDNISITSLNGEWEFLERLKYGDVGFDEDTLARLEEGGRFKVIAFAETSTEEKLWFSAYADMSNGETLQLFDLKSDIVNIPLECIFEINPADGQKFTNIWFNGNIFDTADLYVYVFQDVSG